MRLKERSAIVLIALALPSSQGAIYPKEIAEKFAPEVKATEYIGTGPFKLAEWKPDQYIRMVRFDDYKARSENSSGYGGARIAYVDEIRWIPVPDVATRVAQMETGELDVADDLNLDAYDRLKANPNVRAIAAKPYYWPVAVFNKKEGWGANQKFRQAWQAAVDIEPILKAMAGGAVRVLPHGQQPGLSRGGCVAHEHPRPPLERAEPGEGQAPAAGGRLQGRACPLHHDAGVQVDV
jgi:peptide/nickel transport system substrate-binding protein